MRPTGRRRWASCWRPSGLPLAHAERRDGRPQGRIAYKAVGPVPLRAADNDIRGVAPSPGWDARYDWTGWLPYEQTPQDDGARAGSPPPTSASTGPTTRISSPRTGRRPTGRSASRNCCWSRPEAHDLASFQAMHGDLHSRATLRLLPHLLAPVDHAPAGGRRPGAAARISTAPWRPTRRAADLQRLGRRVHARRDRCRLGKERFEKLYGKRLFRNAVEHILERDDKAWCGSGVCRRQRLRRWIARWTAAVMQGDEVARLALGRGPPRHFGAPPVQQCGRPGPLFEVRRPTGGDPFTVNVGQYHLDKADAPYANRHAASLRALYDLADPERSVFIYQTGQSGNVLSSRYRDMSGPGPDVDYRPLRMSPEVWRSRSRSHPEGRWRRVRRWRSGHRPGCPERPGRSGCSAAMPLRPGR
jgi:penicillin G amidase